MHGAAGRRHNRGYLQRLARRPPLAWPHRTHAGPPSRRLLPWSLVRWKPVKTFVERATNLKLDNQSQSLPEIHTP